MKYVLLIITTLLFADLNAQQHNLDYYTAEAHKNSPLINKSKNDNKIIQLDIQQIKSILTKPQVNVEAAVLFAPIISHDNGNKFEFVSKGADSYTGYDLAFSDGGQYNAGISVTQPVFTGSRQKAYNKKADVTTLLNDNNIKLTIHELDMLVSHQYLMCLKDKKQSEITAGLIGKLKEQIAIMQKLVDNAIYRQTDLMIMKIELGNFEIEYEDFITKYKNNISDLNLLCGINDTATVELKDVDFELKPDTVTQSQFLKNYLLDSLNIEADMFLFDQKYKPQLSLFANAGMNSTYLPAFNRFGFAAGVNFTWNIFDGNQKKFIHDKSFIKQQTIQFEKSVFLNKYNVSKNKYLAQIGSVENRMKIVERQLTEYRELMNLFSFQLSQAQVSIMDYKNLVRDISAKKQEYLLLDMQRQALINSYNYWNF